jgi:hypothetical protein
MALSNYTDLKAAVLSTMHRPELTAEVADFITLGESRINARLVSSLGEVDSPLTAIPDSRYITLPSGFGSKAFALWDTTDSPRFDMVYLSPEILPVSNAPGRPRRYTVDGANIAFEMPCNSAYTYTLRHKKRLNLQATETNDILTNYPAVYLYAALTEGAMWTHNDAKAGAWSSMFEAALQDALVSESQARGNTTLVTDLVGVGRSNILNGGF